MPGPMRAPRVPAADLARSPAMTPVRAAQFGTGHGHAAGKLLALQRSPDVELAGVFEPDPARRDALRATGEPWAGVNWLDDAARVLDDPTIVLVASEGRNDQSLGETERLVEAGKHVWYDKPAGEDWARWQRVVARRRGPGPRDPGGLHVPLSPGLPADRRLGARRPPGRRLRHPGAHVDLDPGGVAPRDRPPRRRHLLRPRRPHAGPDRVAARPADRGHGRSSATTTARCPASTTTRSPSSITPRALALVDIAAMEPAPMARRFEVYGTRGSAILGPFEPSGPIRLCLQAPAAGFAAGEQTLTRAASSRARSSTSSSWPRCVDAVARAAPPGPPPRPRAARPGDAAPGDRRHRDLARLTPAGGHRRRQPAPA